MLCRKMCRAQRLHENPSLWNGLPSRVVSEAPLAARKAFKVKYRLVSFLVLVGMFWALLARSLARWLGRSLAFLDI